MKIKKLGLHSCGRWPYHLNVMNHMIKYLYMIYEGPTVLPWVVQVRKSQFVMVLVYDDIHEHVWSSTCRWSWRTNINIFIVLVQPISVTSSSSISVGNRIMRILFLIPSIRRYNFFEDGCCSLWSIISYKVDMIDVFGTREYMAMI